MPYFTTLQEKRAGRATLVIFSKLEINYKTAISTKCKMNLSAKSVHQEFLNYIAGFDTVFLTNYSISSWRFICVIHASYIWIVKLGYQYFYWPELRHKYHPEQKSPLLSSPALYRHCLKDVPIEFFWFPRCSNNGIESYHHNCI